MQPQHVSNLSLKIMFVGPQHVSNLSLKKLRVQPYHLSNCNSDFDWIQGESRSEGVVGQKLGRETSHWTNFMLDKHQSDNVISDKRQSDKC